MIRHHSRGTDSLCYPQVTGPLSAEAFLHGVVEVVDSARNALFRSDPLAGCRLIQQMPSDAVPVLGARLSTGWLVVYSRAPAKFEYRLWSPGLNAPYRTDSLVPGQVPLRNGLYVTTHRHKVIASGVAWPFLWAQRDHLGTVVVQSTPVQDTLGLNNPMHRSWVGLAVIPLDRGFIQTLADPRSDRRLLVRYDETGNVAAVTELSVPVGFMDSRPELNLALGLRETDRKEILVYRWHWHNSSGRRNP